MNIHWLTIVGIVFIGAGTLLTYLGQQIINDRSSRALQDKTLKIENLSEENIRLSREITRLSEYNSNLLTGGDSFPFVDPSFNVVTPDRMDLWLVNGGLYPLYDVTVTIRDLVKLKQITSDPKLRTNRKGINLGDFEKRINVGTMRPAQIVMNFFSTKVPKIGEIEYIVEIVCRNSFVQQKLHIKFLSDGKREYLKKEAKVNGKIIDHINLYDKISRKE